MNPNDARNLKDKEQEYKAVFEDFINSDETKTFSKDEVKQIIEAHLFREIIDRYQPNDKKSKTKNIIVTSQNLVAKWLNVQFLFHFFLSYLFFTGFLVVITTFIYQDLISYKPAVFIIGLVFTIIHQFVQPYIFLGDLITFTFHKIGLLTLSLYTITFFLLANIFDNTVSIEKAVVVSIIVLILAFLLDLLKRDSQYKTRYLNQFDEEDGSDSDE